MESIRGTHKGRGLAPAPTLFPQRGGEKSLQAPPHSAEGRSTCASVASFKCASMLSASPAFKSVVELSLFRRFFAQTEREESFPFFSSLSAVVKNTAKENDSNDLLPFTTHARTRTHAHALGNTEKEREKEKGKQKQKNSQKGEADSQAVSGSTQTFQ